MMEEQFRDTDSVTLRSESEDASLLRTQLQKQEINRRQKYILLTLFNLFIFIISMLSMICAVISQKDSSVYALAKLMDQHGIFSPAMHAVEYQQQTFSFPMPINQSQYVGTTDNVDKAWKDISEMPDQMVSLSDFPMLGKPADSLQVTNPSTGETGYRVRLEVFHQLHCLNLLRMSTHPDVYHDKTWAKINRTHLDHCIEALRVDLMCLSDVNAFTFHTKPGREGYWPDYESKHLCRNFDKIKDWANENAVPFQDVQEGV